VGFCWHAGEHTAQARTRTLSIDQRERVIRALPYRGVNLTHGDENRHGQLDSVSMMNWLETARAIRKLDLVVTVDTGVAHLAAAMGRPTWVILPSASAWQYLTGYDYHPFYPTMRLFRNRGEGIDNAVDACISALEAL
jgi:ADP-heptose:LPS heptosyltransferase